MVKTHVYCVPFPGGGHGVNMVNVANILAEPDTICHMLVQSSTYVPKWLKSSGQSKNDNVSVQTIGNGIWEDWKPATPADYVTTVQSQEFTQAIAAAVQESKGQTPNDHHSAIIFNALMTGIPGLANEFGFKKFVLSPIPYYMLRLAGAQNEDGSSNPTDDLEFKGIGSSSSNIKFQLGDATDMLTPMARNVVFPILKQCDGHICSNTNLGLEGDSYAQDHLSNILPSIRPYFLGHIVPPLYEQALDDPEAYEAQLGKADLADPTISFLNKQPDKSVVFIAIGSVASFSIPQAQFLIQELRKHHQKWVIVFLKDKEALETAIVDHPDGIITSWAPQLEVLLHPATKCIISHAGFGTMIESVFAGQPCITAPLSSDNFLNTKVMLAVGICVGSIAVNANQSMMTRRSFEPQFHDDGGKTIVDVFARAFGEGGEGGDAVLATAREATLALRRRMADAKRINGAAQLADLRKSLAAT